MNILRKWVRDFFGFSGREVNGFLVLLPLMMLIIFSEPVYRLWLVNRTDDFTEDRRVLDSLAQLWNSSPSRTDTLRYLRFGFNPNKTSMDSLQQLGFRKSLSTRIASYRQKGGTFRIKSDLLKIYGMDSTLYAQLYDYILLPESYNKTFQKTEKQNYTQLGKPVFKSKKDHFTPFDLNVADTTQLKSVYGIGSKLALRILKFRDAVGGFIHTYQLKEVYGLDTAVIQKLSEKSFIAADFKPRKININTSTEQQLSSHPYMRKTIAKTLVAYRFQHGNFTNVEDIRKVSALKPEDIDKLIPYLTIGD